MTSPQVQGVKPKKQRCLRYLHGLPGSTSPGSCSTDRPDHGDGSWHWLRPEALSLQAAPLSSPAPSVRGCLTLSHPQPHIYLLEISK